MTIGKTIVDRSVLSARFVEKLVLHARTEEEVLYPASILTGEYIGLKLKG